jgi:hypothetical protein
MKLHALTTANALSDVPFDIEELRRLELTVEVRIEEPQAIPTLRRVERRGGRVIHAAPRFFAR